MKYSIRVHIQDFGSEYDYRTLETMLVSLFWHFPKLYIDKDEFGIEIYSCFPIPNEVREYLMKEGVYRKERDVGVEL